MFVPGPQESTIPVCRAQSVTPSAATNRNYTFFYTSLPLAHNVSRAHRSSSASANYLNVSPMKIKCPYCNKMANDGMCDNCQKPFKLGVSDGNRHSYDEIDEKFRRIVRMGELKLVGYRDDQFHCDKCGHISDEKMDVCPSLIAMAITTLIDKHQLGMGGFNGLDKETVRKILMEFMATHKIVLSKLFDSRTFRQQISPAGIKFAKMAHGLTKH